MDSRVQRFWIELPGARLHGNVLCLPEGVYFMGLPRFGNKLFIPESFPNYFSLFLIELQAGKQHFVFTGTPGIGKSRFAIYCLWRLSHEPNTRAILYHHSRQALQHYLPNGEVEDVSVDEFNNKQPAMGHELQAFYLVDLEDLVPPLDFSGVTMVFASPNPARFRQLLEREGATRFYLPPWRLDEIMQLRASLFRHVPESTVEALFGMYGGVPRNVLQHAASGDASMEQALVRQESFGILMQIVTSDAQSDEKTRSVLVHLVPERENPTRAHICWASQWVVERLLKLYEAEVMEDLSRMVLYSSSLAPTAPLRSWLFEAWAHRQLAAGRIKLVQPLARRVRPMPFPRFFSDQPEVFLPRDDLALLPAQFYHRPAQRNMSSVDAFAKDIEGRLYLFQMTVASRHPVKGSELRNIINTFGYECQEVHLIFVIPQCRNATEFNKLQEVVKSEGQKYKKVPGELKSMQQWVCALPLLLESGHLSAEVAAAAVAAAAGEY
jgi:hypothetical protein